MKTKGSGRPKTLRLLPPKNGQPGDHSPLSPHLSSALSQIEKAIGGRVAVGVALQHLPGGKAELLVNLLADPANDARGLALILESAGLSVGQFIQLFKDARLAKAQVEAICKVAEKLPAVTEDVMTRAAPQKVPCQRCEGTGKGKKGGPIKCFACAGTGKVEVEPDLERQKVALELGGLLKKAPAVINNVQQNAAFFTSDHLATWQTAMDKVIYGERKPKVTVEEVVDAEA